MYEAIDHFIKRDLLQLPVLASDHGGKIDDFMVYVHWVMVALFIGWSIFFLYTLWRFRVSRNAKADHRGVRTHASNYVEGLVAVVEGVLLIGFSIPLWAATVEDLPDASEATEVYLMAQQFDWNFRYPGPDGEFAPLNRELVSQQNKFGIVDPESADDFTTRRLVVPVDQPVLVHVSSLDVIHSFAVHPMRVTQDAIPGMSVPVGFTPTQEGEYQITCAQLCGSGHSRMSGVLEVKSQEDYETWVAENSQAGDASAESEEEEEEELDPSVFQ